MPTLNINTFQYFTRISFQLCFSSLLEQGTVLPQPISSLFTLFCCFKYRYKGSKYFSSGVASIRSSFVNICITSGQEREFPKDNAFLKG